MTTDVTVKLLAMELHVSVDHLICQFANVGINKTDLDSVSQQEKKILFMHINHNKKKLGILNTLTWQRKIRSTLNVFNSSGKSKKVQIEVRKKHTYLQSHAKSLQKNIIQAEDIESSCLSKTEISSNYFLDNRIIQEKNLKNELSPVKLDDHDSFDKKGVALITATKQHKNTNKCIFQDTKLHQYRKNKTIVRRTLRDQKNSNIISEISLNIGFKENNSSLDSNNRRNLDNRKKVEHDRRFRTRQRLRSSKLRSGSKTSTTFKNRKSSNNNRFFEMRYERDELRPIVRNIKSKQRKFGVLTQHTFNKPTHIVNRDVVIGEMITVSELANKMSVKGSQVIKVMMQLGAMVTINQVVDQQTAQLVAEEMGHHVILRRENDIEDMIMNDRKDVDNNIVSTNTLEYRAPIVTIMGHVDHGKTSLLDCIRSSKLVAEEVGGITQRIGAYCVEVPNRGMITFLDTPGHSAFIGMRTRGVQITDIVVLVVAVDDGVMLQTIEAIQHVKVVNIPMIVALNKIDKEGLDSGSIDRVKNELVQHGVISEEWGGETQFVSVSAKLGVGIDDLLNAILLESEILELKAARSGIMASGIVIDSYLDKGRGPVAVVLIREGILKCGDIVLCGLEYGRVRAMRNEIGCNVDSAGPSIPVEVFGLSGPPFAGDLMMVVRDERKAREVALYRQGKFRSVRLSQKKQDVLENAFNVTTDNHTKSLNFNIVLKADIQGSVEAISDVLKGLSNSDVRINIVGAGVGGITEADVSLAVATRSILLGFNVRSDMLARRMIECENLGVYYYSIIYDLIDDVKEMAKSILLPKSKKKNVALAEVRDVFVVPKLGNIAGCMVIEGVVRRHNTVRVLRKGVVVYEGGLESLRRFKDDVNEVRSGMECGMALKNCSDICSGDLLEIFENIDVKNSSSINS